MASTVITIGSLQPFVKRRVADLAVGSGQETQRTANGWLKSNIQLPMGRRDSGGHVASADGFSSAARLLSPWTVLR